MKPTIEIIEAYTNNLSEFTFKVCNTDKGEQYAFCSGNYYHDLGRHVKNVNMLIAPEQVVLTEEFLWTDDEEVWEKSYYFEVLDPLKVKLNELRTLVGMPTV